MTLSKLFATALLAAGLAACTETPTTTPPVTKTDGGALVGRSCSVDAECGALRCDFIRKQCICLGDVDCPGGYCNNFTGLCVKEISGCKSDAECGEGKFCNPDTRACVSLRSFCESCATDLECGQDALCIRDDSLGASFCGKGCTASTDCPNGGRCEQVLEGAPKQCIPAAGSNCRTFRGCEPDSLATCNSTAECANKGDDQVCDPARGQCVARTQVCALGTVCDPTARVCVNACTVDQDCSQDGTLKCVNRLCTLLSECFSDQDCPNDKVCNFAAGATKGECVNFCGNDLDCGLGKVCQLRFGSNRRACIEGCVRAPDCGLDELCLDAQGAVFVAGGAQTLGECKKTSGTKRLCQSTEACNACELCATDLSCQSASSRGVCKPCDPNRGDADCSAFGTGSRCLSLGGRDANGNIRTEGPFGCGTPCSTAGSADQAACPKGFVCAALTGPNGQNSGASACVPADFDCRNNGVAKCP